MTQKLFVYGTLGLGCPNEHVLKAIGGSWETGTVTGVLKEKGWGAEMGFPGIVLDKHGAEVEGFLFTSENLSNHWENLDSFEGDAYHRMTTKVKLKDESLVKAYIYTLMAV